MLSDEAIPLPRNRIEAKQMAQQHAVRARVGHDRNAQVGAIEVPHRQCLARAIHTPRRPVSLGTSAHALDEVARRLSPARKPVPTLLRRTLPILLVGGASQLGRSAVPVGLTNLAQKRLDYFRPIMRGQ